ncbi:MAG: PEP-CTERM system histidine kinase PrsK [Proteobacteria bacterium]|nr:PEP-CTERM system histidine kinase PrsK [Pseudomonadota bacterium]
MNVILASHLLCAAAYLVLALLLTLHSERRSTVLFLIGACTATGLWSLVVALGGAPGPLAGILDILRVLGWVAFLGAAYRAGRAREEAAAPGSVFWATVASGVIAILLVGLELAPLVTGPEPSNAGLVAGLYGRLGLVVTGLMLAEALISQARSEGLWRVQYLCLGVGALLVYDLFVWSEALLFHRVHAVLESSRGAVGVIVAPLIAVAAARNPIWATELNVARRAVLHATILVGVGIYTLVLAAAGAVLRATGGDWGLLLQAAFVFGGLLLLTVLAVSPSARSLVKLRLSRYLFTHRHDYREQWHRFADALSSPAGGASLGARSLRAISGIVGSPRGGLWLREPDGFTPTASVGMPRAASEEVADSRFAEELERNGDRILEFADRTTPVPRPAWLPRWLREWREAWLLVPLVERHRVRGFIVLGRPPGSRGLDREDEELLRSAAHHAASYLGAEQTARALEESRRFEELSRGLAFIAHDLRNLANELTLTLANARKHIENPEFQRDLLLSMEDSVAGMRRLLDKLAERKREPAAVPATDFAALVRNTLRGREGSAPPVRLDLDGEAALCVACDPDRLVSMSGHLLQNAIEAAGADGHVTVRLHRDGNASVFEVEDDGPGMTAEFVRERLRHPFRSSKSGGYGLGLYECRVLARQSGGELAIESAPGRGTVARLRLPLAPESADASRPDVGR